MQLARPPIQTEGLDPSRWIRKRHNQRLWLQVNQPLKDAREAGFDPWAIENGRLVYRSNPTWDAAVLEFNRRYQAYQELKSWT